MQVSPTPSEIIRDLLPPKELRSVQIDGTHHDLFAEGRFEDWHRRFVAAAKKSGSLFHNGLIEFFQVMSEDDLDRFDRDLGGIENFDGAHEWLFRGGFYDRVEALPGWESQKRDLLRLEEEPPPEVRPSRPGIIQFLPSPLEWPYLPSTVNPPSPFLEWPSLPFPVNPIAALPTANPPVRHLDVSRGDRLSLCAAFSKHGMVGNSLPLVRLYSEAAHICESIKRYPNERPNLLITGSPGSGKELLAKAVSAMAGRPKDLFRAINCGAIPDQLVESELFGVVPGYPGFHDKAGRKGLFQEANNGTVQLDEIGRASDKLQTLLLRVLQEREIRPLGGKAEKIDILFISTGNEILSKRMEEGEFARDVYERISGERIEAPSLVPRYEDVPLLVRHFLRDRPDSPLDPYRFSLAMVLREIVIRKKVQSVRTLQGYVGKAVSLSLPLRLASQEAESHLYEKARLRDVLIEAGFPDRELPKKAWVARQLNMKSRSQLSDTRSPWPGIWNSVVRELEFESSEAALSNKDGKS